MKILTTHLTQPVLDIFLALASFAMKTELNGSAMEITNVKLDKLLKIA